MSNGLIALHSNRIEDLLDLVIEWQRDYPLPPLAEEVFLVQSNGMAQWLKLKMAADRDEGGLGIQAGQRFEMPSRFLWNAYRAVLGEKSVPAASPYDKATLQWRLMRLLPELVTDDAFAVLRDYLDSDDHAVAERKRLQLSQQLADTFDQYQVYRADWLEDWAAGRDQLSRFGSSAQALPPADRWQAQLWRRLVTDIDQYSGSSLSRGQIHQQFIKKLQGSEDFSAVLPPRITVFGLSSLPHQTLEALSAIGRHSQVMLMVNNPCQHYWGDIRQHAAARQNVKQSISPEQSESEQPLLATWGQQGRDYLQLLSEFDNPERYRDQFERINVFTSPANGSESPSLLQRLQHSIYDLQSLSGGDSDADKTIDYRVDADELSRDFSLRFHSCHSAQREVEVLHDQLLAAFERDPSLRPQDIIVMVPDIQRYAAHIEAVFGLYKTRGPQGNDPRYLPYTISDSSLKGANPTVNAIEQLLHSDQLRFSLSDILGMLESPALQRRFKLEHCDPSELKQWLQQAGVRWGLDAEHRSQHDLPEQLEANTWGFGLNRLLLGYSSEARWNDIEPCAPFAISKAGDIGALWQFIDALDRFSQSLRQAKTPRDWSAFIGETLLRFFDVDDEVDTPIFESLHQGLEQWVDACQRADFNEAVPLSMLREELLPALDSSGLNQRFLAGCINFASLMPMRAVPFKLVCLLGLNDGDYPRQQSRQDFDLMRRREHYRPGDRSRRDDDRYLFLEALLSARQGLYLSWVGRNIRDNSLRAQSILLAQLRDDVATRFQLQTEDPNSLLDRLTLEHPLQASSLRYLNENGTDGDLFTYAREWFQADHSEHSAALGQDDETRQLSLEDLRQLLRSPVEVFLRRRLKVFFSNSDDSVLDQEPFSLDNLERFQVGQSLLEDGAQSLDAIDSALERAQHRWLSSGQLPPGEFGDRMIKDRIEQVHDTLERYQQQSATLSTLPTQALSIASGTGLTLEDWVGSIQANNCEGGQYLRLSLAPGTLGDEKSLKYHRLLKDWLEHLAACSLGYTVSSRIICEEGSVTLAPVNADQAQLYLQQLISAYHSALQSPLPISLNSACAYEVKINEGKGKPEEQAVAAARNAYENHPSEGQLRCHPNFDDIWEQRNDFLHWLEAMYQPLVAHSEWHPGDELHTPIKGETA